MVCCNTNTKFSELSAYKIVGGKKFKENIIQKFRDEKLRSSRANHLCTLCYKEFIRRFLPHANIIHEEAPPNATPNVHDDVVEEDFTNVTQNLDILPNAVQEMVIPDPTQNVEVYTNIIQEEAPPNVTPNVHGNVVKEELSNLTLNLDISLMPFNKKKHHVIRLQMLKFSSPNLLIFSKRNILMYYILEMKICGVH